MTSVAISTLPAKRSAQALSPPSPLLYISLSLACSTCRLAHHSAELHCAAPLAKSDAPPASSLEPEPSGAAGKSAPSSSAVSPPSPAVSRKDWSHPRLLPQRRQPNSAALRRTAVPSLLRPNLLHGELPRVPVHLMRAPFSSRPVTGACVRDDRAAAASPRVPPAVPSSSSSAGKCAVRSTCLRRMRRVLGPDYCAAIRRRQVKAVPPP